MLRDKIIEGFEMEMSIRQQQELEHKLQSIKSKNLFKKQQNLNELLEIERNNEENTIPKKLDKKISKLTKIINNKPEKKKDKLQNQFQDLESKLLEKLNNTIPETKEIIKSDIYNNLDTYYKDYIEHRQNFNNISHSSIRSYNASIRYLNYFIDEDTIFNFKFFKDVQKKLQTLPKNFFKYKKYYELSYDKLIKLKHKENYETLNTKTINNHINSYMMFFKYLQYEEIIEENPLNNIIPLQEEKGTIKEEYSEEELIKIFNSDMDKEYLNMCKIALYCGLRLEEVLSIKKENIKDNLIHIELKNTSTKNHQRIIPIHKNLLLTIEYQIKSNKTEYLFFKGNSPSEVKNVGKRLNRRIQSIIPSKLKTYHSFRKNFSQNIELETNAEEKTKTYLMGHSTGSITHNIYNRGKFNIEKLVDCIDQITFDF